MIENDTDSGPEQPPGPRSSQPYLDILGDSEKALVKYQERCDKIDEQYASLETLAKALGDREFQIFWANLEVLKPTIYTRPPMPAVQPRHSDGKELHRKASELLERVLEFDVEEDDLHETMLLVRDDLATLARGVAWVLDDGSCRHIDRKDFRHDPARKWSEVGWVAKRAYLTRDEISERFPEADRTKLNFQKVGDEDSDDDYQTSAKKAQVWEIWHKGEQRVIWVSPGYPFILDEDDPLFDVKGFFPCPKPAFGTVERGTLKPVPDWIFYRDQIDEINEITARISSLSESLRLKGFYAAGETEVGEAIEAAMKATDNKAILMPISSAAVMGGKSLSDSIVWMPLREVGELVSMLIELRKQLIQDVYEITGLSDIMRGATEASETATAQNLKAQYGSVRVRERQQEIVRIIRDVFRIKAEIFAEQYSIEELVQMAGMEMQDISEGRKPVDPMMIDQLLKSQRSRPFVLDVESDSTIVPNEQAEKEARIEFITAVGGFIQQAGQMVAAQPETAPFAAEMLKFTAGGFRAGRELGASIDDFAELVAQKAEMAQQQGPTPEQIEAQQKAQEGQAKLQLDGAKLQLESRKVDIEEARFRLEAQRPQAAGDPLEGEKIRLEREKMDFEREKMAMDMADREADRRAKGNEALVSAGMPPDYSFNDDREQFQAIMGQMQASNQMMMEMLAMLKDGQTAIAASIASQAQASALPKRVVRDDQGCDAFHGHTAGHRNGG